MATMLHLSVPDEQRDEDVIEEYYDHVLEKHQKIDPEVTREDGAVEEQKHRQIEKFRDTGEIHIMQSVSRDYAATEAWDRFFGILDKGTEPRAGGGLRSITDESTLKELVSLLKNMKEEMKEMGGGPERNDGLEFTAEDCELEFEVGPIALIEFALEHGYGVTMDY